MDESTIDWWSMSLGLFGGLSLFYGGMIMGLGLVFLGMTLVPDKPNGEDALHEARRLMAEEPKRIPAYTLEIEIIETLQRIYYFAKRMAKTVATDALVENA